MHFRPRIWWASFSLLTALLLVNDPSGAQTPTPPAPPDSAVDIPAPPPAPADSAVIIPVPPPAPPDSAVIIPIPPPALVPLVLEEEEPTEDEEVVEAGGDGLAGKGSLGLSMGAMKYLSGNELSDGSIRPILHGVFKYAWNERLVSSVEGGWGWNAYGEGGEYDGPDSLGTLATVVPLTVGLDYRFYTGKPSVVPRVGGGIGAYLLTIRAGRDQVSRDPLTDKERKTAAFGFYGKVGCEFMIKPTFWLNTDLMAHQTLSGDADAFPRGWLDDNAAFIELRVGLNYYFTIRGQGASVRGGSDEEEEE